MLFFLSLSLSIIPFNQTWPPSSVLCVSSWHLHLSCSISQKPSSHQWHIPPFQPHSRSLRKSQPSIQPAKYSHICPLLFLAIATILVPATIFPHLVWTIASSFSFEWFLFLKKFFKVLFFYFWGLNLIYFFYFINIFHWSRLDLQCVNFCCTAKWFSYTYIYIYIYIHAYIYIYTHIHFLNILFHFGLS